MTAQWFVGYLMKEDWVDRHTMFARLVSQHPGLADEVATLMPPDLLLAGSSTGAEPPIGAIPLPGHRGRRRQPNLRDDDHVPEAPRRRVQGRQTTLDEFWAKRPRVQSEA